MIRAEIILVRIKRNRRHQRPVRRPFELLLHSAVIRFRIVKPELIFLPEFRHAVELERRKIKPPLIADDDSAAVGNVI